MGKLLVSLSLLLLLLTMVGVRDFGSAIQHSKVGVGQAHAAIAMIGP